MRKGFGICCILLGICCLIASVGLIVYNHWEEEKAQSASESILQDVRISIQENTHEESTPEESVQDDPTETSEDVPQEMHTTPVGSYDCIGVLTIPVLELELPVLSNWNYAKLKVAPCQYFYDDSIGNIFEDEIPDIFNSPWIKEHCKIAQHRKQILEKSPKCISCKIKDGCNFGCIGIANDLGNIMSYDGLCDLRIITTLCYSNRIIELNEVSQKTNVVQVSHEEDI